MDERQCWNCGLWDWKNKDISGGGSGQEEFHGLGWCKKHNKGTRDTDFCDDYEPKSQ